MSRSYDYFPLGTVHMAIVDPGVGTEREMIVVQNDGHLFMAPDNGLLAPILEDDDQVFKLDTRACAAQARNPSTTFHGRDIFAPLAAELAAGRTTPVSIDIPTDDWTPGWLDDPQVPAGKVTGIVVTVDAFGNLISNIDGR